MPKGKELEQLPMSTVSAPGTGDDTGADNRDILKGLSGRERPFPAKAGRSTKNGD